MHSERYFCPYPRQRKMLNFPPEVLICNLLNVEDVLIMRMLYKNSYWHTFIPYHE